LILHTHVSYFIIISMIKHIARSISLHFLHERPPLLTIVEARPSWFL
jgi:hypothetical protein